MLNRFFISNRKSSPVKTILAATLLAGTMDMLAAIIVYDVVMQLVTAKQILLGIAAGLFGKNIIRDETATALIGLLLHYFIAFCFAAGYFLLFPYISFLKKNKFISGLLYGLLVWLVMNLIVVPLSSAYHGTFTWIGFFRGVVILIFCVGLPVSYITAQYHARTQH